MVEAESGIWALVQDALSKDIFGADSQRSRRPFRDGCFNGSDARGRGQRATTIFPQTKVRFLLLTGFSELSVGSGANYLVAPDCPAVDRLPPVEFEIGGR